jgi:hypothetical protein
VQLKDEYIAALTAPSASPANGAFGRRKFYFLASDQSSQSAEVTCTVLDLADQISDRFIDVSLV